jgi:hypothetical protein
VCRNLKMYEISACLKRDSLGALRHLTAQTRCKEHKAAFFNIKILEAASLCEERISNTPLMAARFPATMAPRPPRSSTVNVEGATCEFEEGRKG